MLQLLLKLEAGIDSLKIAEKTQSTIDDWFTKYSGQIEFPNTKTLNNQIQAKNIIENKNCKVHITSHTIGTEPFETAITELTSLVAGLTTHHNAHDALERRETDGRGGDYVRNIHIKDSIHKRDSKVEWICIAMKNGRMAAITLVKYKRRMPFISIVRIRSPHEAVFFDWCMRQSLSIYAIDYFAWMVPYLLIRPEEEDKDITIRDQYPLTKTQWRDMLGIYDPSIRDAADPEQATADIERAHQITAHPGAALLTQTIPATGGLVIIYIFGDKFLTYTFRVADETDE